jgi:hypothetical protein
LPVAHEPSPDGTQAGHDHEPADRINDACDAKERVERDCRVWSAVHAHHANSFTAPCIQYIMPATMRSDAG